MAMKESGLVNRRLWAAARNASACLVPPGQEAGSKTSSVLSVRDLGGVFLVGAGGQFKDKGILLSQFSSFFCTIHSVTCLPSRSLYAPTTRYVAMFILPEIGLSAATILISTDTTLQSSVWGK